jgi:hypothetical protein
MIDDEEAHRGCANHFSMDEAFCARMRMAIEAGLESAPIGVVTAPGTKNPLLAARCGRLKGRRFPSESF